VFRFHYRNNSISQLSYALNTFLGHHKQRTMDEMIRVARPGAQIVIADESEKGARAYERLLPGFLKMWSAITHVPRRVGCMR